MKKVLFSILGMALLPLFFSSCKKEYTCKCTVYFENGASLISKDKVDAKSIPDANAQCNAIGQHNADVQSSPVKSHECGIWEE